VSVILLTPDEHSKDRVFLMCFCRCPYRTASGKFSFGDLYR